MMSNTWEILVWGPVDWKDGNGWRVAYEGESWILAVWHLCKAKAGGAELARVNSR